MQNFITDSDLSQESLKDIVDNLQVERLQRCRQVQTLVCEQGGGAGALLRWWWRPDEAGGGLGKYVRDFARRYQKDAEHRMWDAYDDDKDEDTDEDSDEVDDMYVDNYDSEQDGMFTDCVGVACLREGEVAGACRLHALWDYIELGCFASLLAILHFFIFGPRFQNWDLRIRPLGGKFTENPIFRSNIVNSGVQRSQLFALRESRRCAWRQAPGGSQAGRLGSSETQICWSWKVPKCF